MCVATAACNMPPKPPPPPLPPPQPLARRILTGSGLNPLCHYYNTALLYNYCTVNNTRISYNW